MSQLQSPIRSQSILFSRGFVNPQTADLASRSASAFPVLADREMSVAESRLAILANVEDKRDESEGL